MAETSSPTVWRRWLAFELTRLRKAANLEQKDVAKALRCTTAKVSYVENAERPVMLRDLEEVLLPLYDVPAEKWPKYLQAARDSRKKGWWESYDTDALPDWFSLFVGLEQGASQLRVYEAQLIPGLLQTSDYAVEVSRRSTMERAQEQVERHVEVRLGRQEVLRRRQKPLRLWAVLDEAVLRRVVGDVRVMLEQLTYLRQAMEQPKITVQVIPFRGGAHPGMVGRFQILDFPWPGDPGVAYVEHRAGAVYLEGAGEIEAHIVTFEHLCALALSPDDSAKMVESIAKEYS
ncbi:helix-turn-helix transcriptional regulator [Saccharopolyspora sp. ASAGF58]|uniref:helix-turn-helix domain-containing protein n=1 Tax=Saccharopolyspora sp. ASAGF58 TaxID=2719023 RepID=UPI00143FCC89|nr:helix-turn-helix transcriptional regulator [Saccharopolyspora sp. ASAGF58]QIZ34174.1 helix-turn-helix domain-containing protein [Saccharopolyspora sp. ASAGF58]